MNPFLQNYRLKVVKINSTTFKVDTSNIHDGVIVGDYEQVTKSFLAEQQSKTSVYDIPYIENILFTEITSAGRDILLYIIYNVKENEDVINLKHDRLAKKVNLSRPTLIKGIQQLIDVGVICKKSQSEYWINPLYVFKGNRINYYRKQCEDCIDIVAEIAKR